MLVIPGQSGKDLCDKNLGVTRRDLLRVGGSGMLGLSLGGMLQLQSAQASAVGGPGWGKAKSVIMLYMQGGPSHLDLWDPKENEPDNEECIQSDLDQTAGHQVHRTDAEARTSQRSVHDDPFGQLHAEWFVQPHGRDLSNDDRLYNGQGQPVWTT